MSEAAKRAEAGKRFAAAMLFGRADKRQNRKAVIRGIARELALKQRVNRLERRLMPWAFPPVRPQLYTSMIGRGCRR